MLGWRLLLSAILIPALAGVFIVDARIGAAAPLLLVLVLLLALRGGWELADLLAVRAMVPSRGLIMGLSALVVASGWCGRLPFLPEGLPVAPAGIANIGLAYTLAVMLTFLYGLVRYGAPGGMSETLGAELLSISYIGLLLAVTAQLRWVAGADAGYLVLASVVITTKSGDTLAYTLGRMFGRRKMCPKISPGKTWMGGLGALLGSAASGYLWLRFAPPLFHADWIGPAWYWGVLYGAAMGVAGLVGDLCESLLKRDVGKKDSAPLMPGFGGLLDLLDSVIFAGPVAWLLWKLLPLATWL